MFGVQGLSMVRVFDSTEPDLWFSRTLDPIVGTEVWRNFRCTYAFPDGLGIQHNCRDPSLGFGLGLDKWPGWSVSEFRCCWRRPYSASFAMPCVPTYIHVPHVYT